MISARAATLVDQGLQLSLPLLDRPGLIAFLFHSLFEDRRQIAEGLVSPQEGLTKHKLRCFIEYFLNSGYAFVTSEQIQDGLPPGGRYLHLTFDDGYANNLGALDILESFEVPATIFVTTEPIEKNKCFWWDVVYRERRKRGATATAIDAETRWLKRQPHVSIDAYLNTEFGSRTRTPVDEIDRPLSRSELSELSRNRWITIGNHTKNHAILTSLEPEEVQSELEAAQSYLERVTGKHPQAVSYPNGNYDATVLAITEACGFRMGLTAEPRKNRLSTSADLLALGRHPLTRDVDLIHQLQTSRSKIQIANLGRRFLRRSAT